jgi:hypothetical protein
MGSGSQGVAFLKKFDRGYASRVESGLAREREGLEPPVSTAVPTLSDQAIRDAILAERQRLLSGTSRRRAFMVGTPAGNQGPK